MLLLCVLISIYIDEECRQVGVYVGGEVEVKNAFEEGEEDGAARIGYTCVCVCQQTEGARKGDGWMCVCVLYVGATSTHTYIYMCVM